MQNLLFDELMLKWHKDILSEGDFRGTKIGTFLNTKMGNHLRNKDDFGAKHATKVVVDNFFYLIKIS